MRMPVANALKRVRDEGGAGLGPAWRRYVTKLTLLGRAPQPNHDYC